MILREQDDETVALDPDYNYYIQMIHLEEEVRPCSLFRTASLDFAVNLAVAAKPSQSSKTTIEERLPTAREQLPRTPQTRMHSQACPPTFDR